MGSSTRPKLGARRGRWQGEQHGVVTRRQLLGLGLRAQAIQHRIEKGRLHPVDRGVYAVGRPDLSRRGIWMAAVLGCGSWAALSYGSAAALWGIERERRGFVEVSARSYPVRQRPRVRVYRRANLQAAEIVVREGIPVTSIVRTLLDIAGRLDRAALERAVNEADRLGLIDPEALLIAIESHPGKRGVNRLERLAAVPGA